ncbi:cell surface immobilization antigen (macronuclear) [Tetrahymena thermophila SB210]|uniref:Cell surface immobilization antigen n=1 Tax=Tetrahymena thermophila (strain SB210) TaxID=312017 RepID=W7XCN6_TETTS|nr:cell surface immobilization antigen [Tetrahymena thermophila SB210]EWS74293.1 cell surface immobilization antigen [Tetrahymena thermophila SB210]|eukprot:XP_012653181.1 cell surface immobilization antigen [Tetrahymena thermophila SB210]
MMMLKSQQEYLELTMLLVFFDQSSCVSNTGSYSKNNGWTDSDCNICNDDTLNSTNQKANTDYSSCLASLGVDSDCAAYNSGTSNKINVMANSDKNLVLSVQSRMIGLIKIVVFVMQILQIHQKQKTTISCVTVCIGNTL